jgi:hypothetical protein
MTVREYIAILRTAPWRFRRNSFCINAFSRTSRISVLDFWLIRCAWGNLMDVETLFRRMQKREREIIAHLSPVLQTELQEVRITIKRIEEALASARLRRNSSPPGCRLLPGFSDEQKPSNGESKPAIGVPLSERKAVLLDFLRGSGATGRKAILRGTGIPAGSLTVLLTHGLKEGWLIREQGGKWKAA